MLPATGGAGVCLYGTGATLTVTGNNTGFLLEGNRADIGGGLYPTSGAAVSVSSGAVVEAKDNTATSNGGGVYLYGTGTTLTATGSSTAFLLEGNSALYGGGLYPKNGATVSVSST